MTRVFLLKAALINAGSWVFVLEPIVSLCCLLATVPQFHLLVVNLLAVDDPCFQLFYDTLLVALMEELWIAVMFPVLIHELMHLWVRERSHGWYCLVRESMGGGVRF